MCQQFFMFFYVYLRITFIVFVIEIYIGLFLPHLLLNGIEIVYREATKNVLFNVNLTVVLYLCLS